MPGGGVPDWFGKDDDEAPRRKRGGAPSGGAPSGGAPSGGAPGGGSGKGPSKVIAFSAIAVAAIGGVIAFNITKQADQQAQAEIQETVRAEERLRAEKARKRMLAEIKKAAEATPEPEPVDPSDLPSIDDVLAEDADESEDEEASEDAGAVGKRDSASVLRITRALNPQVQRCYETQLARDPDLRGRANVTLQISEEGRVSKATVQLMGQLPPAMRGCIAGVFTKARFEPASDVATVKLPIIFSANR